MSYPFEKIIREVEYARPDGKPVCLDIYPAADQSKPAPVVVLLHGGGWAEGDKSGWYQEDIIRLTDFGYTMIAVQYRLSDRAPWPAHIQDCKTAVRYIRANAAKLKIDPDHIAAMGGSAGGHLAAMMAVSNGVEELEGAEFGYPEQSSDVCAAMDLCGPSDMLAWYKTGDAIAVNTADCYLGRLLGGPVLEKKDAAISASPTTYVSRDSAPLLILHGVIDDCVSISQSDLLVEKLKTVGAEVEYYRVPNTGHGIDMIPFREITLAFFDRHMKS